MDSKAYPRRAGVAIALAILFVLAVPFSASASCISPPPYRQAIEDAPAVFVGEVVDVTGGGRWATVKVHEVWTGGDLRGRVEVRGGPRGKNVATSADRRFKLSREYLFLPYDRKGSVFLDNACTRTTLFRPELDRFRPTSATATSPPPSPEISAPDFEGETDLLPWLLTGAAIAALATMALVIRRRR